MAGLCGLKILLLWAGLIGLASSQNTAIPPITTVQQPCYYSVIPIKFGLQISIMNSTPGNFFITIREGDNERNVTVRHINQTSTENIMQLKPLTVYEHIVTFNGQRCKRVENATNETRTSTIDEQDISEKDCPELPRHVCYQSEWNIGSSLFGPHNIAAVSCETDNKTFCIKPRFDDICSDMTTTFTSGNRSFNYTTYLSVVPYLNPSEIEFTPPNKFPAKIEPKLPPKCGRNLTVEYTCLENGVIKTVLEPFTNYTCTGQIMWNNTNINETTKTTEFKIDCDLQIEIQNQSPETDSIYLDWTTEYKKCRVGHSNSEELNYACSCESVNKKPKTTHNAKASGGTCRVNGLTAYTNYICTVKATYNRMTFKDSTGQTTLSKKPDDIGKLSVTLPENNVINVSCKNIINFYGPKELYKAQLKDDRGNILKEVKRDACKFQFTDLSYLTAYKVTVFAYNGDYEGNASTEDVTTYYNNKAVIGFLVFLIILTSLALLFVIYKIYVLKHRKSHDLGENMMLISTTNDEENLMTVEPIAAEVLLETYKRKLADEGRLFLAEFQSIPRIFSRQTMKEAKKSCNAPKNRYVDILPYDYNRVQLTTGNGEAGCDYINASFIDGYKESKKYIAAQGPKEETVGDFWRMIWEQQSSIIVMVTRCEEGNRLKCAQYWPSPERETEIFEEFIVKLNSEDHCPDYTIRHLTLINKREKNTEREVTHIQFVSWPDHGVPGEPHLLLKLRRRVNAFKNFFSGPIVVHCSAGVGRTGTYIGIDAMMEGLEADGRVDIYGYVVRLRRQRCLMVQVEAQYILIHQALLEHNQFGETEISLSELHSTVSTLRKKNSGNEPTLMEDEFERLPVFRNWRTFNTGITEENKRKNRSSSVIPYDYNRVLLKIDEGRSHESEPDEDEEEESSDEEDEDSTKYINASHIDGYWSQRAFIVAQTPLPDTMDDFWSMIYQKKVSAIVMLSDCSEGDKDSDCIYWDEGKKLTFGDFEVEVASTETGPTFISRAMLIRHVKRKDSRQVKHFQFLKWANRELPERPQDLTDMIKDIKKSFGSNKSHRNMTVLVHCNDGSTRSGIFCALWNMLDSAETEKLVDVFQVAKTLRKERQGMITSLEQYQFLYDTLEAVFPVQNGEVKAVQASAEVQIVNETKTAEQPAEAKAEQSASTTSDDQQGEAESAPLVADEVKEEPKEKPEVALIPQTETTPLEETSNGPTASVEV